MNHRDWVKIDHVYGVKRIYGIGSEKFGEYHGGYLNFGWWEEAGTYIEAAEALVHKMAEILGLNDQSRLLDVACGMGAQDVYLHRHFGAEIDAVEILWNQVQVALKSEAGGHGREGQDTSRYSYQASLQAEQLRPRAGSRGLPAFQHQRRFFSRGIPGPHAERGYSPGRFCHQKAAQIPFGKNCGKSGPASLGLPQKRRYGPRRDRLA